MQQIQTRIVLGSRSPRRLELLRLIVQPDAIEVLPPSSSHEPGFDGLTAWPEIEQRLLEIARLKCDDVLRQVRERYSPPASIGNERGSLPVSPTPIVLTADTVIVAADAADAAGTLHVLPQPPEDNTYEDTVRYWFQEYYAGKTHTAATAMCLSSGTGHRLERLVKSYVTFTTDMDCWLDWYIATNEPRGKAGGYALQGAGSLFVTHVEGSLSNVVGLPIRELMECLEALQNGVDP